jgi:hypothetical protein
MKTNTYENKNKQVIVSSNNPEKKAPNASLILFSE